MERSLLYASVRYEFFTVCPDRREYRWKWRDAERAEESQQEFARLEDCMRDARRHGFLEGAEHQHRSDPLRQHRLR